MQLNTKMAVLASLNVVGLFRRWLTVALQFPLRNEQVTAQKQEDGSAECRAVAALYFNSALFMKQNHHQVQEYKQDRFVFCSHNPIFFSVYSLEVLRAFSFVCFVCFKSPLTYLCLTAVNK
jgi:hypothetical protein